MARSYFNHGGVAFAVWTACLAQSAVAACDPPQFVRDYLAERYEQALNHAKWCIDENKRTDGAGSWLKESNFKYWHTAASQVAAEMGRFEESAEFLQAARSYFTYETNVMTPTKHLLTATEGMYLERSGRLAEAESLYLAKGDEVALARLAVLALNRGDKRAAADWAGRALRMDPTDLTSHIVLASLTGSVNEMLARRLEDPLGKTNQWQPMYYAEVWWARTWLKEAGRMGPPPRLD